MVCLPVPPLPRAKNYFIVNHFQLQSQTSRYFQWVQQFFHCFGLNPTERSTHRLRPGVDITHHGLDGVVPGDVLQRKGVRVLSRLGQKPARM